MSILRCADVPASRSPLERVHAKITHQIAGGGVVVTLTDTGGEVMIARLGRAAAAKFAWGLLADLDPAEAAACGSPVSEGLTPMCERIATEHGLTPADLRGPRLMGAIVAARHQMMAEARLAGHSTPKIGKFLGGRDHTTVIEGARAHRDGTNWAAKRARAAEVTGDGAAA